MAEQGGVTDASGEPGNGSQEPAATDRLSAHERLSTGGLARWTRACAAHPWRVVTSWVGIIAVLILLVAAVGGSLRDEFEIPGSETQRATDLIESEFASEQGGVLNLVFAAPAGERLDTPERKAAILAATERLQSPAFAATEDRAGVESVGDPFEDDAVSDDGRIAYTEAQFDRVIYDKDREAVVAVQDAVREEVESAGITAEFDGDAEFPPLEQGTQELLGLLAALIVLLLVFRTFVAALIPIVLAIVALVSAFLLLVVLAGLHHPHGHGDAAARVDDRAGGRHRLLSSSSSPASVQLRRDGLSPEDAGRRGRRLGRACRAASPA